jgi:hypothetical protein
VFCVMLIGSKRTLAPISGRRTDEIRNIASGDHPSGFPEIDSPLMNRAAVNAEATVVSLVEDDLPCGPAKDP